MGHRLNRGHQQNLSIKPENLFRFLNQIKESAPLQAEYQSWLNTHKQVELNTGGTDQYKDLNLNDENVPSPDFNDSGWPSMVLPAAFEKVTGEFDGAVWFRKTD